MVVGMQEGAAVQLGAVVGQTERLVLREFASADAAGFFELNADPHVLRYTGDAPFRDIAAAQAFIEAYDAYTRHGFGRWSVYERESGDYIGFCGLAYRADRDEVDVGFRLRRDCWGRGYATEAASAALRLGFERFGLTRIVGRAMRDNAASHQVLRKLGMTPTHEFEQDGVTWVQYEVSLS
jgi:[ribosomal protein S5]-alanine N-acetyltransferase